MRLDKQISKTEAVGFMILLSSSMIFLPFALLLTFETVVATGLLP